jgi:hypothetical protein
MATFQGFEASYTSGTAQQQYRYTIVSDANGVVSVRNIQSPYGLILDSMTRVPQSVVTDINNSIATMETLLNMTSTINGNLTFAAETSKSVTFATPVANTNYRVVFSVSDFVAVRVTSKTTTGFTVEVNVTYSGVIGYDVFV